LKSLPAVHAAAQILALHSPLAQIRTEMRTTGVDRAHDARSVAIDRDAPTEHLDAADPPRSKLARATDHVPRTYV